MSKLPPEFVPAEAGSLVEENALLRASLELARDRIEALERGAENDPLTGLPARARFLDELARVAVLAQRHTIPAALLNIDVKALAAVNAAHGRAGGDAVLLHISRTLKELIRTSDFLARNQGGEFALILDHLDMDSAIETAERIARCVAGSPVEIDGRLVRIAVTVGVTGIMCGDSVEDVLERAGLNMAFAKAEG
jgi:diguanylate cyclase (GGDEF)-like protein